MPRSRARETWSQLCSPSSSEVLPCDTVGLIRTLVIASSVLALVASLFAFRAWRLSVVAAGISNAPGVVAAMLAWAIDLRNAQLGGFGLVLHSFGVFLVMLGGLIAWMSAEADLKRAKTATSATTGITTTLYDGEKALGSALA
mmetsp:Transcript_62521/g.179805  ORF Transcript_62521/g.179805 Transcript_62521/m.179805 type:complete len:143 (+) Transcript_62521:102-530(+)